MGACFATAANFAILPNHTILNAVLLWLKPQYHPINAPEATNEAASPMAHETKRWVALPRKNLI
jgi:hypothetical protein